MKMKTKFFFLLSAMFLLLQACGGNEAIDPGMVNNPKRAKKLDSDQVYIVYRVQAYKAGDILTIHQREDERTDQMRWQPGGESLPDSLNMRCIQGSCVIRVKILPDADSTKVDSGQQGG